MKLENIGSADRNRDRIIINNKSDTTPPLTKEIIFTEGVCSIFLLFLRENAVNPNTDAIPIRNGEEIKDVSKNENLWGILYKKVAKTVTVKAATKFKNWTTVLSLTTKSTAKKIAIAEKISAKRKFVTFLFFIENKNIWIATKKRLTLNPGKVLKMNMLKNSVKMKEASTNLKTAVFINLFATYNFNT